MVARSPTRRRACVLRRKIQMAKKSKTKAHKKAKLVMGEFKKGKLRSGSKKGPKVKNRKQAIAIALSEGRKAARRKS